MSLNPRIRNDDWKNDNTLKEKLKACVSKRFQRKEIIDLMNKYFSQYAWSVRTLSRRMAFFGLKFIDYNVSVEDVQSAVEKELEGPGSRLGYRALTSKVRVKHGLNVPRNLVYDVLSHLDPDGLRSRGGVGKKKRIERRKAFKAEGPNYVLSLDGHDRLCGFQKSMFPLCIYGGLDTYSGKIVFLNVWTSNNNPKIVARMFFNYICESKVLPINIRIDHGTETDILATMHGYLLQQNSEDNADVTNHVMHGPSTQNKIERWWRELHHRMETFFKDQLHGLVESGNYDTTNQEDR